MDSLYKKLELLIEELKKAKEEKPSKSKSITVGANNVKITAPGIKPKTSEPKPEKQIEGRQASEFEVHANVDHLFDKGEMCKFLPNGQWSLEKAKIIAGPGHSRPKGEVLADEPSPDAGTPPKGALSAVGGKPLRDPTKPASHVYNKIKDKDIIPFDDSHVDLSKLKNTSSQKPKFSFQYSNYTAHPGGGGTHNYKVYHGEDHVGWLHHDGETASGSVIPTHLNGYHHAVMDDKLAEDPKKENEKMDFQGDAEEQLNDYIKNNPPPSPKSIKKSLDNDEETLEKGKFKKDISKVPVSKITSAKAVSDDHKSHYEVTHHHPDGRKVTSRVPMDKTKIRLKNPNQTHEIHFKGEYSSYGPITTDEATAHKALSDGHFNLEEHISPKKK